jgi:hypothetical protein
MKANTKIVIPIHTHRKEYQGEMNIHINPTKNKNNENEEPLQMQTPFISCDIRLLFLYIIVYLTM